MALQRMGRWGRFLSSRPVVVMRRSLGTVSRIIPVRASRRVLATGMAVAATASFGTFHVFAADEKEFLGPKSTKDSVKYNYELRIRLLSTPEKVFEYFASTTDARGQMKMTPYDFMLSLTPAATHFRGKEHQSIHPDVSAFFNEVGCKDISFGEYLMFITLLAVPETEFGLAFKMFDLNGDGVVDSDEFVRLMKQMRDQTSIGQQSRGGARSLSQMTNADQWEFERACRNNRTFFGQDGRGKVNFAIFQKFMLDLRRTLLRLEFDYMDYEGVGAIQPQAFALSILGHARLKDLPTYFERVKGVDARVPEGARISFDNFLTFNRALAHVDLIDVAIRHYEAASGSITRSSMAHAARAVAGVELGGSEMEVLFHLFDRDGSGTLESSEFTEVFRRKKNMGLDTSRSAADVIACFKKCAFPS